MITTVIFDLDGLLTDTESLHYRAYRDVLAEWGIELAEADYAEHWIRTGKGIVDYLARRGLTLDVAAARRRKASRYAELVRAEVRPMPGAVELLTALHGRKTLALASAAFTDAVTVVLATLHLRPFFAAVVAGDEVRRVKPAPDLFAEAARRLGCEPAECVVLEDSEKGVVAARAAGMRCLAVPNAQTRGQDFSRATRVLASLAHVDLALLDSLG